MKKINLGIMVGVLLAVPLPALAERGEGHWEGREIHRFDERDIHIWRRGHWIHGRHEGRRGWWWVAAGIWYFYPVRVAEIPDPYTPPVTVINQPPPVVVQQVPVQVPPQPPAQSWYYCDSAKGYYPYVPSCPEAWRPVPAQPPQAAPH